MTVLCRVCAHGSEIYCRDFFSFLSKIRDVTKPAKIHIHRMRILCAKSVRCGCGFAARSKLVPAIIATAIT